MLTLAKLFQVSCIHVITQIWIFLIVESFVYPGQLPRQGKKRHISCQMKVAPDPVITELPVTCPLGTQPCSSRIATGQPIPCTTSSCHLNSWFLGTFPLWSWQCAKASNMGTQVQDHPGFVMKGGTRWSISARRLTVGITVRNMFASILFSNIGSC